MDSDQEPESTSGDNEITPYAYDPNREAIPYLSEPEITPYTSEPEFTPYLSEPESTPIPYPSEPAPMPYPSEPEPTPIPYSPEPEPKAMPYLSQPEPAIMPYPSVPVEQYLSMRTEMAAVQYPSPPQYSEYNVGAYSAQPQMQPGQQVVYQYQAQSQPQVYLHPNVSGQMQCPQCRNTVVPRVTYKNGMFTWVVFGALAILMIWPCCFIPFCVNSCKDEELSCPACQSLLQINKRM